jgi:preprotein translocase subunit SecG
LKPPITSMTKGFLIVICIIIAIALIIFPLIVSHKAQKNKKNKN